METKENGVYVEIGSEAGSVTDAVVTRHSIREFQDKAVPEAMLREIYETALRAPSWKNSQPWEIHLLTGRAKARMANRLMEEARSGQSPRPDTAWTDGYPSDVRKRMFDLGMKIYGVAGIDRKDKGARDQFMLRNFEFFDAPAAMFLTTRLELSFWTALDVGCFLQTVMLLAREKGLGTCPQAALSAYPDIVRSELQLDEKHHVVVGMSLGYPKVESALNRFHTPRESSDQVLFFHAD